MIDFNETSEFNATGCALSETLPLRLHGVTCAIYVVSVLFWAVVYAVKYKAIAESSFSRATTYRSNQKGGSLAGAGTHIQ